MKLKVLLLTACCLLFTAFIGRYPLANILQTFSLLFVYLITTDYKLPTINYLLFTTYY